MATRKTKSATSAKTVKASRVTSVSKSSVAPAPTELTRSSISSKPRLKVRRLYVVIAIVVIALIGLAVYFRSVFVVATVNGQVLTRLAYIKEAESIFIPESRTTAGKQALNQLVTKTLIYQEAQKKKVTVSEKEVDDQVAQISKDLEKSGQKLDAALALQGETVVDLKERIKLQKLIEKLVGKDATVTEKEISEYLETNKANLPQDTDPAELKTQVKEQLKQQKINEKVQALIQNLQKNAKVTYFTSH